jgi:hypothetical protein
MKKKSIMSSTGPALRLGNGCNGPRPVIFRGLKYFVIPTYSIIENKKSIIFKE